MVIVDTSTRDIVWHASVRSSEIGSMSQVIKEEFINELEQAIQSVCWKYGVHN